MLILPLVPCQKHPLFSTNGVPGSSPVLLLPLPFLGRFSLSMSRFSLFFRRCSSPGGADAARLSHDLKHYPLAGLTIVNANPRL